MPNSNVRPAPAITRAFFGVFAAPLGVLHSAEDKDWCESIHVAFSLFLSQGISNSDSLIDSAIAKLVCDALHRVQFRVGTDLGSVGKYRDSDDNT
jgi:hypothetical protein